MLYGSISFPPFRYVSYGLTAVSNLLQFSDGPRKFLVELRAVLYFSSHKTPLKVPQDHYRVAPEPYTSKPQIYGGAGF